MNKPLWVCGNWRQTESSPSSAITSWQIRAAPTRQLNVSSQQMHGHRKSPVEIYTGDTAGEGRLRVCFEHAGYITAGQGKTAQLNQAEDEEVYLRADEAVLSPIRVETL